MFRHTPVTLYICGRPKIGKSHLLINIVKSINEKLYHFKDYNKIVYARTVTTEHWDGYIQQPIIIFDDHYKMHDGEQKTDASEVMNVVSCTNYYPSFAFLHNKGTPVNSDILLITSNVGWPSTIFLPTALQRRHKHHLIVVHNDKPMNNNFDHLDFYYCEGIIDPWNGNYSAPYTFTRDIPYSTTEMDNFQFRPQYKKITYNEIVQIIVNDVKNEHTIFNSIINNKI